MRQKTLLSKLMLLLCAIIVGSSSAWADEATITFASQTSGTSDGSNAYSTSNFVSNGISSSDAAFGTITCSATSRCYSGKTGYGLKAGASSNAGSFTIAFSSPLTNVTKITLNRASYSTSKTATITVKNGSTTLANSISTPSGSAEFSDMEITNLNISSLSGLTIETSKYCYIKSITVTYTTGSVTPTCATPTFSPAAGTFTSAQNVTINTTTDGATIYYTTDGNDPTTNSNVYSSAIPVNSTTTIKAMAVKEGMDNSAVAEATYTILEHAGTAEDPYTVAVARAAIDANVGMSDVYVAGIVSQVDSYNSTYSSITYWISDDGTTTNQFEVYSGKGIDGADFSSVDDVQVGDVVVVKGNIKKYQGTYEFDYNNELVSLTRKEVSSIALSGNYTTSFVEGGTFNHDGVVVTATYSDNTTENVTDRATFTEPDMTQIGEQTITVTFKDKTASYKITITELPKHNAIFSINGTESTQEFKEGAAITFPSDPADIAGKTFVGWAEDAINGTTDTAPSFVTSATMGNNNVTFYAVFATQSGSGTPETATLTANTSWSSYSDKSFTDDKGNTWYANCTGSNISNSYYNYGITNNGTSYFESPGFPGFVTEIIVKATNGSSTDRNFYIKSTKERSTADLGTIAVASKTTNTEKTASLTDVEFNKFFITAPDGALQVSQIAVTYSSVSFSGYCTTVAATATITLNAACHDKNGMVFGTYSNTSAFVVSGDIIVAEIGIENDRLNVVKYSTGNVVPANTGVMVSAIEGGNYTVTLSSEAGASVLGNANRLRPTGNGISAADMAAADASCLYYRLTMHNGTEIGYWYGAAGGAAFDVAANKAYLAVPVSQARSISGFAFDEEGTTTAIEDIHVADGKNAVYNLNGQRVNNPAKGMYIVNGKKVIK